MISSIELIEDTIAQLKHAKGRQTLIWDADLKGFGVLLSGKTNTKSYVVQHRLRDGRTRRVTIGPCNVLSADEARERAREQLSRFYAGEDPKARNALTVGEALSGYIAARDDELSAGTIRLYRAAMHKWLAPWLPLPLHSISPDMVSARRLAITETVRAGPRGYTGNGAISIAMSLFKAAWNWAANRNADLGPHPVRRMEKTSPRTGMVPLDQMPAFYRAVCALPSPIFRDYLLLLLFTGLRRNEAAGLRWTEVDFVRGIIHIPVERTKERRQLDLPMVDCVRDLLVARRAIGNARWVFPSNASRHHIVEPKFALRAVKADCGVGVSVHDLRRTYMTVASVEVGISTLILRALVNHSPGKSTTAGYVIMTTEDLRVSAQRVADRLLALCNGAAPKVGPAMIRSRAAAAIARQYQREGMPIGWPTAL